jgi:hypothetical protein
MAVTFPVTFAGLSGSIALSNLDNNFNAINSAIGTAAGNLVALDGSAKLPAVDGSQLTNLPTSSGLPAGHLFGLTLSNNGTATKLDVAAGRCRNSTNSNDIILSSAITGGLIQTSGSWAAGSNQNKLDTGARTVSTWYHVHAIYKDNVSDDWLFSLSPTAPTLPSGYTKFRRIGSVFADSGTNITAFVQRANEFWLGTPVADVTATNQGASAVTKILGSVPTGVSVKALMNVQVTAGGGSNLLYLSDLSTTDQAPSFSAAPLSTYGVNAAASSGGGAQLAGIWTDTAASIRTRQTGTNVSDVIRLVTLGWLDPQGRFV